MIVRRRHLHIWIRLEINEVKVCCNNVPSQQKIIQISKENVIYCHSNLSKLFAIIQEESCLKPDFECVVEGALINNSQNSLWISLTDCPRICGWTYLDTFLNVILLSQLAWFYSKKINKWIYSVIETSEYIKICQPGVLYSSLADYLQKKLLTA